MNSVYQNKICLFKLLKGIYNFAILCILLLTMTFRDSCVFPQTSKLFIHLSCAFIFILHINSTISDSHFKSVLTGQFLSLMSVCVFFLLMGLLKLLCQFKVWEYEYLCSRRSGVKARPHQGR